MTSRLAADEFGQVGLADSRRLIIKRRVVDRVIASGPPLRITSEFLAGSNIDNIQSNVKNADLRLWRALYGSLERLRMRLPPTLYRGDETAAMTRANSGEKVAARLSPPDPRRLIRASGSDRPCLQRPPSSLKRLRGSRYADSRRSRRPLCVLG